MTLRKPFYGWGISAMGTLGAPQTDPVRVQPLVRELQTRSLLPSPHRVRHRSLASRWVLGLQGVAARRDLLCSNVSRHKEQ